MRTIGTPHTDTEILAGSELASIEEMVASVSTQRLT